MFHSAWNELDAKYCFQFLPSGFFAAVSFQLLMSVVGVLPLGLLRHLMERLSLMTTGHIQVKSEACRMHFKHFCQK